MKRFNLFWKLVIGAVFATVLAWAGAGNTASGQGGTPKPLPDLIKGQPIQDLLSSGGNAALFGPEVSDDNKGEHDSEGDDNGANTFVNDPCLDPPPEAGFPENRRRTVQSETEIAVLNGEGSEGKKMVAGYNDSFGFYNNRQGLSGFSYTTDGGNSWIDGGGLPPKVPSGAPAGTPGSDAYFGDPVVVVHHKTKTFYYASIYLNPAGFFTLSVNRGRFRQAPPQGVESKANTRCQGNPARHGIPDPPGDREERIIWEPPVEAVLLPFLNGGNDFLDKEWLYVDQKTGFLYMTYTRFGGDGSTPLELVRSFDRGQTWTPPTVIVPNEAFDFNQATQPITTPTGRVIVTWNRRRFATTSPFPEISQAIEVAVSDDNGQTFSPEITVAVGNPQREPRGYNRGRRTILNAPYIAVDKGSDDGVITKDERKQPGFGNVYITYFDGTTTLPALLPLNERAARIRLSRSTDGGTSWGPKVLVSDDGTLTTHVFPSVQVNNGGRVFVTWIDRRVDPVNNALNDTWGVISKNLGLSFGANVRITDVSADWSVRADARPNFGDYNSSELINFKDFASIWGDGRFPPGTFTETIGPTTTIRRRATPDTLFAVFKDEE